MNQSVYFHSQSLCLIFLTVIFLCIWEVLQASEITVQGNDTGIYRSTFIPRVLTMKDMYNSKVQELCPNGSTKCDELNDYIQKCSHRKTEPGRIEYFDVTPFIHEEPNLCRGHIFLFIAIHSRPDHFVRRKSIRTTWASLSQIGPYRLKAAFFLGRARSEEDQELIDQESKRYRDIIQRDYHESYRNMTRKHITVMEWTALHCSHSKYLLKTDDDTFIDPFHVIQILQLNPLKDSFYCTATRNSKPVRRAKGPHKKWVVTRAEFRPNMYPVYCEGLGYLVNTGLAKKLYWCSIYSKFFWIDDVYITGILAEKIGAKREKFWNGHGYTYMVPSHASSKVLDFLFFMASHNEFMPDLWKKLWRSVLRYSMDVNVV